jgi:hypothetical protein
MGGAAALASSSILRALSVSWQSESIAKTGQFTKRG